MQAELLYHQPCNYELLWKASQSAIVLRVHPEVIISAPWEDDRYDSVKQLQQELKAEDFGARINTSLCPQDGFAELAAQIPSYPKSWRSIKMLTAALQILLLHLNHHMVTPRHNGRNDYNYQLMALELNTLADHLYLGGIFSPEMSCWLSDLKPGDTLSSVAKAMRSAYNKLHSIAVPLDLSLFTAEILAPCGFLQLSCPGGNGNCRLQPRDLYHCQKSVEESQGCEFFARDLSDNRQQLTLLAGLAQLHNIVRQ